MDNQFKNVKTHARLLSKAMWYEWRMKLLEGLKEGLMRIEEGMVDDDHLLAQQEQLLDAVMPDLIREHGELEAEATLLQNQAHELADCDQDELKDARDQVSSAEQEIEAKRAMVKELRSRLARQEESIEQAAERKAEYLEEIKEAERVREDNRGWRSAEVASLKGSSPSILPLNCLANHPQPMSTPCTRPTAGPSPLRTMPP